MSEELYTASEAREKLGKIATSTFHRLVLDGRIRKVTPLNKKQGMYVKEDVDALAKEISKSKPIYPSAQKHEGKITVDWMSAKDLPGLLALDMEVYQEELIGNVPLYYSWWKKNPKTCVMAFDASNRSRIFGQITLLPLRESTIISILKDERSELSISAEEIETYDKEGDFTLLAESAVCLPKNRECLRPIMHQFAEFWCERWPQQNIQKIYAKAISTEGSYLAQKLFFGPIHHIAENSYMLDLRYKNPSKIIREFQECIKRKEQSRI